MATDFAPWSISKAKVAYDCNQRFFWKYQERLKGRRVERSEGRLGTAVHQILERTLQGDEYDKAFRMAAIDAKLTRNEMLTLATFRDSVMRFLERFGAWCEKYGVKKEDILIEEELSITANLTPTGYWSTDSLMRGLIDIGVRVRLDGKLFIVIIDHKTGNPREMDEYVTQLKAYGVMACAFYPEVEGVQPVIHWPKAEEPQDVFDWGPMWTREQIETELVPWLHSFLDGANERGLAEPKPVVGWYCEYCEFRHRCPLQGNGEM